MLFRSGGCSFSFVLLSIFESGLVAAGAVWGVSAPPAASASRAQGGESVAKREQRRILSSARKEAHKILFEIVGHDVRPVLHVAKLGGEAF